MAYKSVSVDVDIELDDVTDYIEWADESDLKAIQEAVDSRRKQGKKSREESAVSVSARPFAHAGELLATERLNELLGSLGVEEIVSRLQA